MTEEETQLLLDGYAAWNRSEYETFMGSIDPDIEWEPGFGALESGVHRGLPSFEEFVFSWKEAFDEFRLEPELLVQCGDRVVVMIRQHGRGHGSGVELDARVIHVWTIRNGKAVRWWGPRTLEEAVDSLGDERLGTVLRGYESFNRGELDEAIEIFDPEIVWHTWIVPGPGGATYRGHDGVRELWSDARNVFGNFRNEPERVVAAGDRVVAFVRVCGRGRESGVEVEGRIAHVYSFRDGKVLGVESYEDRERALREAGIA